MIEKILFIGAWVFLVLGIISFVLGFIFQNKYEGSLEEILDSAKGIKQNYYPAIRFGLVSIIISAIVLAAHYS